MYSVDDFVHEDVGAQGAGVAVCGRGEGWDLAVDCGVAGEGAGVFAAVFVAAGGVEGEDEGPVAVDFFDALWESILRSRSLRRMAAKESMPSSTPSRVSTTWP